jgi:hypothetical protein
MLLDQKCIVTMELDISCSNHPHLLPILYKVGIFYEQKQYQEYSVYKIYKDLYREPSNTMTFCLLYKVLASVWGKSKTKTS